MNLRKVTNIFAGRLDASFFAIILRIETILVAAAPAIPEATAASIFGVEEVFNGVVVATIAHVLLETASLLWRVRNLIFTGLKVGALSLADPIWAAAELTRCTSAAFEVWSFSWCDVI